MTFSIDDVRDSISNDMASFVGRIEEAAATLVDRPLDWPAGEGFEAISSCDEEATVVTRTV